MEFIFRFSGTSERKTEEVLRGINRAFLTSEGSPAVEEYQDWELVRELSRLQVPAETLERPFHTLSNGEKTKCLLAALFLQDNGFLLIDEPTNHLDAEGRRVVSDYLRTKPGFLLVSHDRAFLDGCVDHILR